MTTITIKDGKKKFSKTSFKDARELFEFLIDSFTDKTVLIKTSLNELNLTEKEAWERHKKDGYDDFVDLEV